MIERDGKNVCHVRCDMCDVTYTVHSQSQSVTEQRALLHGWSTIISLIGHKHYCPECKKKILAEENNDYKSDLHQEF